MVAVLVILDGAAEDPRLGPTSLERARTPVLDALCARGAVEARWPIPPGLPPGSEVGVATLLGARLVQPPSRGLVEAAAHGIRIPRGTRAWRVDAPRGQEGALLEDAERLGLRHLRGHRFLAVAPARPVLPGPWRVWPDGAGLRRVLDASTVVVAAAGAAAGCARLLGARVVVPPGATGDVDTDLGAKAEAALASMRGARRVVVHVGGPDEAAHRLDPEAKRAVLERVDRELLAPLVEAVRACDGTLEVTADHGTCPRTGRHLPHPVPAVRWGRGVTPAGPLRLQERALVEVVG